MGAGLVQPAPIREGNQAMVSHEKLNCEHVWREISNYIDGEVDAALRSTMDEHFKTCQRCASVLAGTRNVVALYGDERMLEVPAGFSQRLELRLEQKMEQARQRRLPRTIASRERWSSWSAWMVPLAATASLGPRSPILVSTRPAESTRTGGVNTAPLLAERI